MPPSPCDIVAFTAHPDDMELSCGGTLALAVQRGWKAGAVDFTRGELATRGTPQERDREAAASAEILGLSCRVNLRLPDGRVRDTDENRALVVSLLRKLRPKVVIAPPIRDHHPDHVTVAELLSRSVYLSGIARYAPTDPSWKTHVLLHTVGSLPAIPTLVVDVSEVYETRQRAIRCYRSQFHQEGSTEPATRISHPDFLDAIDARCRHHGALIGVTFGEAFVSEAPVPVSDLVGLYSRAPWDHTRRNR